MNNCGIRLSSVIRSRSSELSQIVPGENSAVVPIVKTNLDGICPYWSKRHDSDIFAATNRRARLRGFLST